MYEQAIKYEKGSFITSSGALATLSGAKTGRSPKDKRVVRDHTTEDDLWWGKYVLYFIPIILYYPHSPHTKLTIQLMYASTGVHPILRWTSRLSWLTGKELLII